MKRIIILLALLTGLFTLNLSAQTSQFSQPTYLTITTNSGVLATTAFQVQIPAIALTITATNSATIVTNTIYQVISYTNSYTFIYNAATMGTNFTTNFNNGFPLTVSVTNLTYGQAAPQSGGSNTCFIK